MVFIVFALYNSIYVFVTIKPPEGSAKMGGIQCSRWIVTCHPIFDNKSGNWSFRVAVEKNIMS